MEIIFAVAGALAGALVGAIIALSISRKDRRLRQRDEIANAIGVPVLASFPVRHPRDAAAWTKLLEDYEPEAVYGWGMRQALHQLRIADDNLSNGIDGGAHSLTVLSLSSDPGALAIGPQLAAFAASLGISTVLYIGPQQDANITATLRTAGAVPNSVSSKRPGRLEVVVSDDGQPHGLPGTALTVVVAVVDSQAPQFPETMQTTTTVLGVSAGAATSDQLARAAVSANNDGREVVGILVSQTRNRTIAPQAVCRNCRRVTQRRLPTRLIGHYHGDKTVNDPNQALPWSGAIRDVPTERPLDYQDTLASRGTEPKPIWLGRIPASGSSARRCGAGGGCGALWACSDC